MLVQTILVAVALATTIAGDSVIDEADWQKRHTSAAKFPTSDIIGKGLSNDCQEDSARCQKRNKTCEPNCIREYKNTVIFWIRGVAIPTLCIIGVASNMLNLFVLTNPSMFNSTSLFLIGLAISDIGALITLGIYFIFFYSYGYVVLLEGEDERWYTEIPFWPWRMYWNIYNIPANIFVTSSNTHAMCVTIFRFCAIVFPRKARQLTTKRTCFLVLLIFLWGAGLNAPEFLQKQIQTKQFKNQTISFMNSTDLFQNRLFQGVYYPIKALLNIFIPWFTCFLLSIFLMLSLKKRFHHLVESRYPENERCYEAEADGFVSARKRRDGRITVTLIAINVCFLVCECPAAIWFGLLWTIDRQQLQTRKYELCRSIIDLFLVLNLALNFFLYTMTNKQFRLTFAQMFLRKKGQIVQNDYNWHLLSFDSTPEVRIRFNTMDNLKRPPLGDTDNTKVTKIGLETTELFSSHPNISNILRPPQSSRSFSSF
ncbi:unnamed protein product [Owenia fusiformis]|uniref:G-protein coupled receptors family 1 profile domain-containing protein n=1 Tax=Owenia fusiformis TaxID=6347 RepID=A0A8S4PQC5_OWEFU|nr:unnamed protein product [Owenia fusiformis]